MDSICRSSAYFSFSITAQSWKGQEPYWFDASEKQFDASRVGGGLKIAVYPGSLGLEWVNTAEIIPE
jgi:hypothetical protein